MRRSSPLHDGWRLLLGPEARRRLATTRDWVPATVPGCVHVDLLAAGLIADPLVDRNELDQQWIGTLEWSYAVEMALPAPAGDERVDLVFEGLDTFATIRVDDVVVGRTENQHRTYRFDITTLVRPGPLTLAVTFAPAATVAETRRRRDGDVPNPYGQPYNYVRKMACNFGWDWGPHLVTAGVWRPVTIERWRCARLAAVRPCAVLRTAAPTAGEGADVVVDVAVEHAPEPAGESVRLELTVRDPDGAVVGASVIAVDGGASRLTATVAVADVRRWWPVGRGAQPCYDVDVTLSAGDDVLDVATRRIGFRHVALDITPDADGDGAAFAFVVNGERSWIRGFNWIPDDCFPARLTPARLAARINEAVAANANLLRVWGGGVYESDDFYDECDRRGVLVWQDFAFACAVYPEELLAAEVRAEAIDNVTRLMAHPSLVVWCGNNENLMGYADWGWREVLGGRPWGEGFYRSLLPGIVADLDAHRPYIDGSPTSLDPAIHPNDDRFGAVHLWDVWNEHDYERYRAHTPRFVAEFGFQAPATYPTLRRALAGRPLDTADPALAHHQRAFDGEAKLERWLGEHFGSGHDPDTWLYLTQLNQADAVRVGVGHFRQLHARCAGVVWWQLNDCWPAVSWAVLDSDGRRKPAWYAARRAFADRVLVAVPSPDRLELALVNDNNERWADELTIVAVGPDGSPVGTRSEAVRIDANACGRVLVPASWRPGGDTGVEFVVATVGDCRVVQASAERERAPWTPAWDAAVTTRRDGVDITVTARTPVLDLCLFAERVDAGAVVDDQLVDLMIGESHCFAIRTELTDAVPWEQAIDRSGSLVFRARGDRPPAPSPQPMPSPTYHRST